MDLSAMLKYQTIDNEISKLEGALMQTPSAKEYVTNKKAMGLAQEQVVKQNAAAGELVKQMEVLIAEYDALEKELKEAESAVPEVEDVTGADFFYRNVQKLLQQIKNLANEISKVSAKIVELNQQHLASMTAGKNAKQKMVAVKPAFEEERAKYLPEVDRLKKELAAAATACSESFLQEYERQKKMKKMHILVPLSDRNCGGCFMELAGDSLAELNAKPYIICPNCGRIVYKQ